MEVDFPSLVPGPGPPRQSSSAELFVFGPSDRPSSRGAKRTRPNRLHYSSAPSSSPVHPIIVSGSALKLSTVSPIVLQALLTSACGDSSFTYRALLGGDLLVTVRSSAAYTSLLGCTALGDFLVRAYLPASLRGAKAVLRQQASDLDCASLLAELRAQGVQCVRYLCSAKHSSSSADPPDPAHRHTFVLEFASRRPPDFVTVYSQVFRLSPYKERPVYCAKCLRYGHHSRHCTFQIRCPRCGASHSPAECPTVSSPVVCLHCKGPHLPGHVSCPRRVRATAVTRQAFRLGLSYADVAKRLSRSPASSSSVPVPPQRSPTPGPSVPVVASTQFCSFVDASTQTDLPSATPVLSRVDFGVQVLPPAPVGPVFPPAWLEVQGLPTDYVFDENDCSSLREHLALSAPDIVSTLYGCDYHQILLFLSFLTDAVISDKPFPDSLSGAA